MLTDFLKSVGGALGLAPQTHPFNIPSTLPSLQAYTAAGSPNPAALTAPQFLDRKLNIEQDMLGATQALAFALPEKKGLQWATDSAKLVEHKLPPAQKSALAAAQAFQASPSIATRQAAAAAAEKAGAHGPGGMAAKAASLGTVPGAPPVPGAEQLVPVCVAGAVVLAVSLSAPSAPRLPDAPSAPRLDLRRTDLPKQPVAPVLPQPGSVAALKNVSAFKPFIDRGLALAAG